MQKFHFELIGGQHIAVRAYVVMRDSQNNGRTKGRVHCTRIVIWHVYEYTCINVYCTAHIPLFAVTTHLQATTQVEAITTRIRVLWDPDTVWARLCDQRFDALPAFLFVWSSTNCLD